VENLALAAWEHPQVEKFRKQCGEALSDFTPYLRGELLDQMLALHIPGRRR
jgi:hypothetical protein